jgi:hypothetical protein
VAAEVKSAPSGAASMAIAQSRVTDAVVGENGLSFWRSWAARQILSDGGGCGRRAGWRRRDGIFHEHTEDVLGSRDSRAGRGADGAGCRRGRRARRGGAGRVERFIIEDGRYANDAAAQAAWKPMKGSAPATVSREAGASAVRLPCNFAGTDFERASWDRAVKVDLAAGRGVRFEFFCPNLEAISQFSLYFQSGTGGMRRRFSRKSRTRGRRSR